MAQAFISQGMDRAEAEALPRAHAITKWLGRDSTDIVPTVGSRTLTEPGWVVVCSDGLWNYASTPAELAAQLAAAGAISADPVVVANRLVEWANSRSGRDNVTVALARYPAVLRPTNLDPATPSLPDVEEPPKHG
jgi:serine/threonine protein phosphatase PrpC